jgi:enolase
MAQKGIIKSVVAYEVIDSRGFPTVAAIVTTKDGVAGKSMVPSGASTGEREALELRDGDQKRFMGKGVLKAVENVNTYIADLLKHNFSVLDQAGIDNAMIALDQKLSGSQDNFKRALGANATLAVSMAVTRAAANLLKKPLYKYIAENIVGKTDGIYTLPVPMLNVINGGAHADNTIDFQEFMFMPIGATSFKQACQVASECFHALAKILKKANFNTSKGDEGGFAPALKNAEEALTLMVEAIKAAGYTPGVADGDVAIALDTASSEIYSDNKYVFKKAVKAGSNTPGSGGNSKTTEEMITYLDSLVKDFPIVSIEDGLAEND